MEASSTAPQVIIIEPSYQDAPHIGSDRPNDNHAPLAIGWGEEFLRRTYEAVTSNSKKWESTMMLVYYDEHGGFYDHVPPPRIHFKTTATDPFTFNSAGPRIPAIIASPLVTPGSVCLSQLDHTSVLQMLAERFTPGKPYSLSVKNRSLQGIESLSVALNNSVPWPAPAPPSVPINVKTALGATIATRSTGGLSGAFNLAATELMKKEPAATAKKYPELHLWKKAVDNAGG
jgi:phospholipase C